MFTLGQLKNKLEAIQHFQDDTLSLHEDLQKAEALILEHMAFFVEEYLDVSDLDEPIGDSELQALGKLYFERWQYFQGTLFDYTRNQDGVNALWIELVSTLVEESHLPRLASSDTLNYLHFLMPTVKNTHCAVTFENLSDIPLNQMILSEDGKYLIPLDTIFDNFRSTNVFAQYEIDGRANLTQREITRIRYAYTISDDGKKEPTYWQAYKTEVTAYYSDSSRVSVSTLDALKTLIERSCFERGRSGDYTREETSRAYNAYMDFNRYIYNLPEEERQALFSHRLTVGNDSRTFSAVWTDAFEGKLCETYAAKYFIELLKNYFPCMLFSAPWLNEWASTNMTSRVYDSSFKPKEAITPGLELSEETCQSYCEQLMHYILTHPFSVRVGSGKSIEFASLSNTVPNTVRQIFLEIKNGAEQGNWRVALYRIKQDIISPELKSGLSTWRFLETQSWLQTVYDETFWSSPKNVDVDEIAHLFQEMRDKAQIATLGSRVRSSPEGVNLLCRLAITHLFKELSCYAKTSTSFMFWHSETDVIDPDALSRLRKEITYIPASTPKQTVLEVYGEICKSSGASTYNTARAALWLQEAFKITPEELLDARKPPNLAEEDASSVEIYTP